MMQSGLKVVGLERGAERETVPDFQSPAIHDELRYSIRKAFMQDNAKVAVSFRNTSDQTALPIRRWESFLPGQGLGGSLPRSSCGLCPAQPYHQTLRPEIS